MNDKMIVVIFDNEKKAYEGVKALKDLDAEGSITLYASAVIAKDASGKLTVKQEADQGPLGTGVGLLTGSLIGLLGGPVGVALGASAGTFGGMLYDFAKVGVGEDFLDEVGQHLQPGKVAVVAEIWEEWVMPVDTRMEAAGGVVFRRARRGSSGLPDREGRCGAQGRGCRPEGRARPGAPGGKGEAPGEDQRGQGQAASDTGPGQGGGGSDEAGDGREDQVPQATGGQGAG